MSGLYVVVLFFFFKQKTAYEMRISDWSSDVCSSDLPARSCRPGLGPGASAGLSDGANAAEKQPGHRGHLAVHRTEHRSRRGARPARGRGAQRRGTGAARSEEARVGTECVSTCKSRWSP